MKFSSYSDGFCMIVSGGDMLVLISVVVVVLALVSDDVISQDLQACECMPYFVCNFTVAEQQ